MPAAAAPATRWSVVLAACAAGVAVALNVGKVPVALGALRSEFGLGLVQAGWVSSMLTAVAVVGAAMFGLLVGRLGALRLALGGLVLSVGCSLATLAAGGASSLLALRLLEGAGFIAVAVSAPALVSAAAASADRRFALGLWSAYMPLGASVAMAVAPPLLRAGGWRALWLATAALLALAALGLWRQRTHLRAAAAAARTPLWAPLAAVVRQPLPWVLALAFGAWATQHFALIIWMPTWLVEQRQASAAGAALLTGLMLVACVPGNLLGGLLVQRGLPRGALIASAHGATGLLGWGCIGDALPDPWRYACSVALSFVGGLIPAAVMASSTVLAKNPAQIATLQGLFMQGSQLGQFAGTPAIAAVVAASGQWASAAWVTLGAAALGVGLGLAAIRLEPQR